MPNNTYLFNSRFKQNAIKFSIAYKYDKWQNIFRYQYNGEEVGIPAHSHSNPQDINLEDITSNSFNIEHFKLTRPNQFVDNQLLSRDSLFLRTKIQEYAPDIDLSHEVDMEGQMVKVNIPLTIEFFWPKTSG